MPSLCLTKRVKQLLKSSRQGLTTAEAYELLFGKQPTRHLLLSHPYNKSDYNNVSVALRRYGHLVGTRRTGGRPARVYRGLSKS